LHHKLSALINQWIHVAKQDFFEAMLVAAGFLVPLVYAERTLGTLTITIIEPVMVLLIIGFALRARREKLDLRPTTADLLFAALVLWSAISLPRAIDFGKSLREVLWLAESALVYYMVSHSNLNKESLGKLMRSWCYGAIAVAFLGLLHYLVSVLSGNGPVRIASTILNSNHLSGYLIIYLPILISMKYGKRKDQRYYWGILATIVSTALVLTYCRGGWYATIIALTIMAFLKDKRLLVWMVVYILIYSWIFPPITTQAVSGFTPLQERNGIARLQLWLIGFKMWHENPITGVGTGNYIYLHDDYRTRYPYLDRGFGPLEPHSSFVKFLAENGAVGLGLFVALLGILGYKVISLLVAGFQGQTAGQPEPQYALIVGAVCGLLAFLMQSNTNSLFHLPSVAFGVWLISGLGTRQYSLQAAQSAVGQGSLNTLVNSVPAPKPEQGLKHNT
jgi:putative inorganic carbon (HCO3(-)) transporter